MGEVVRRLACEDMAGSSPAAPRVALLRLGQRPEKTSCRFDSCPCMTGRQAGLHRSIFWLDGQVSCISRRLPGRDIAAVMISPVRVSPATEERCSQRESLPPHQRPCASCMGRGDGTGQGGEGLAASTWLHAPIPMAPAADAGLTGFSGSRLELASRVNRKLGKSTNQRIGNRQSANQRINRSTDQQTNRPTNRRPAISRSADRPVNRSAHQEKKRRKRTSS